MRQLERLKAILRQLPVTCDPPEVGDEISVVLPPRLLVGRTDVAGAASPMARAPCLHVGPETIERTIANCSVRVVASPLVVQIFKKQAELVRGDVAPLCPETVIDSRTT